MRTMGIYMRNGEIERVVTDDRAGAHVVVYQEGAIEKLMRAEYEAAITTHVLVARNKNAAYGIALACEIISERTLHLSRTNPDDPYQFVREIEAAMASFADMINKAMGRPTAWVA